MARWRRPRSPACSACRTRCVWSRPWPADAGGRRAGRHAAGELRRRGADRPAGRRDDLAVASINSPSQTVIYGAADALAEVTAALTAQSRKVTNLAVSHAFHSPLMREVFDEFRAALTDIEFHEPSMTVVSNLTGKPARLSELVDPEYWVRHIGEPVNFLAGMRSVERRGNHNFVEIGPSNALMGLARQCLTPEHHRWLASLDRRDEHGDVIRESVAALYRAGATISWTGFHAGRERGKINPASTRSTASGTGYRSRDRGTALAARPVTEPFTTRCSAPRPRARRDARIR
ncbi:acyltransferase domain-containing protein, partial [Salinispora arenicola]|uniref:acyltransferase domain-containing protein n=1 Tax=Salinispora arenicola TaxID=168697 RepID=UPI0027DAFABA